MSEAVHTVLKGLLGRTGIKYIAKVSQFHALSMSVSVYSQFSVSMSVSMSISVSLSFSVYV
jgi:hypothetical protein